MEWHDAVDAIRPHVMKIETPDGFGTGFLISLTADRSLCGIATAAHVVSHANQWEEPIRIKHHESGQTIVIRNPDRLIMIDAAKDTAAILCARGDMPLSMAALHLIPEGHSLRVGNDVGWVGFPAISPESLCFFSGQTSCLVDAGHAYLVDGVAINGVSGGPAFHIRGDHVRIIGVVSAYIANRATGEALPGLCVVRDVSQFQTVVGAFKSLDEAKSKRTSSATPGKGEPGAK